MNKEYFNKIVSESISKSEVARKIGILHSNGTVMRKISKLIERYDSDISHFSKNGSRKLNGTKKKCPVCDIIFEIEYGARDKTTCSNGCANTFFRSGEDSPNYKGTSYRQICFRYHKKECIICGENLIISVHHYDGNHKNDDPKNLIPLCSTHHQYLHSRHKYIVKECVDEYVENYM